MRLTLSGWTKAGAARPEDAVAGENLCPTCGAPLKAGQTCPFCAEAQRLVAQLAEQEEVRLCARCGTLLQPAEEEICDRCWRTLRSRALQPRREDRVARWISARIVEPLAGRGEGLACPSCGQDVPPLAIFCPYCGQKMTRAHPAAPPGAETSAVPGDAWKTAAGGPPAEPILSTETASGEGSSGLAAMGEVVLPAVASPVPPGGAEQELAPAATTEPSWLERARAFLREQFEPFAEEWRNRPHVPLGERMRQIVRSLFLPGEGTPAWLWATLFIVLAGLAGAIIFWIYLLNSGVRLR